MQSAVSSPPHKAETQIRYTNEIEVELHEEKIVSVLLTLSLLAGCLFCLPINAGALYYSEGQKLSRVITREGIVMLKNENEALPIRRGATIAVFGDAQCLGPKDSDTWYMRGYIPYGFGSQTQAGDFENKPIDPLDALNEAESNKEISIFRPISDNYAAALANGTQYEPTDEDVHAGADEL